MTPIRVLNFALINVLSYSKIFEYVVTITRGMEFLDVLSYFLSALSAFTVYWYYYSPERKRGMKHHWEEMYLDVDMETVLRGKTVSILHLLFVNSL